MDLSFLKDKEIDYVTGVNILNMLHPQMVTSLLEQCALECSVFQKTLDGRYLKPPENSLFKLLEFPIRRIRHTEISPEGSSLICAVDYGLEVFFGKNPLPHGEKVYCFDDKIELDTLIIRSESNESISLWNLPFAELN